MADNKTKVDRIHDQLPSYFKSRQNINWKAVVEAIGAEDQFVADLVETVRKQFFVKAASRPYLDKLGANVRVDRPRFIGMDDPTFRNYIPVLAYRPKQVKLIIDSLLDIFFFKESTTAFIETTATEPFYLENGWELEYSIDAYKGARIQFSSSDFVDIANATADEVVAAINRQTKDSFAIVFNNSVTKQKSIRLFTKTIGSKGSLRITGGRANIGLRFNGFVSDAGNGVNTEWTVTKVGDLVTFEHTAGNAPGIEFLKTGDIFISDIASNIGSFVIEEIIVSSNKFTFRNLFGTPGVYTQTSDTNTKFIRPYKAVVYTNPRRAVSWETKPGQVIIEMPTSPPVVRRSLAGSAHINGLQGLMTGRISDNELTLENASLWPDSGTFIIEKRNEIKTRILTISEDTIASKQFNTRILAFDQKYTYTGKSGDNITGITPDLPFAASLNDYAVTAVTRNGFNELTVTTSTPNDYQVGEWAIIEGASVVLGFLNPPNGTWRITEILSPTSFKAYSFGDIGSAVGGTVRVERIGLSDSGSRLILVKAVGSDVTKIKGPYIWDSGSSYVLSSYTGPLVNEIKAGQTFKTIDMGSNNLPSTGGQVIFDFGTEFEEGPVRYLFKPSANSIAIAPAYVFQHGHTVGSAVTAIRKRGPHTMSSKGTEFAPYVTDTAIAREILQELILTVKSVGIFVEFLVRYPEQLYATIDVYRSGVDPE